MMEIGQYTQDFTGEYPQGLAGYGPQFAPVQQPGPAYSPSNPMGDIGALGGGLPDWETLALFGVVAAGGYGGYKLSEDRSTGVRVVATLGALLATYTVVIIGSVLTGFGEVEKPW